MADAASVGPDAASVGPDAGSIRHGDTLILAPILGPLFADAFGLPLNEDANV